MAKALLLAGLSYLHSITTPLGTFLIGEKSN
jgi:hypothetical protein